MGTFRKAAELAALVLSAVVQAQTFENAEGNCYPADTVVSNQAAYPPLNDGDAGGMTHEICNTYCQGFAVYAHSAGTVCACGSPVAETATPLDNNQCTTTCSGNNTQNCGGTSNQIVFPVTFVASGNGDDAMAADPNLAMLELRQLASTSITPLGAFVLRIDGGIAPSSTSTSISPTAAVSSSSSASASVTSTPSSSGVSSGTNPPTNPSSSASSTIDSPSSSGSSSFSSTVPNASSSSSSGSGASSSPSTTVTTSSTESGSTAPTSTVPTSMESSSTVPTSSEFSSTVPTSSESSSTVPTSSESSSTVPTSSESSSTGTASSIDSSSTLTTSTEAVTTPTLTTTTADPVTTVQPAPCNIPRAMNYLREVLPTNYALNKLLGR